LRAAGAVIPTRTPSVHAAREHAITTGLCSAARVAVPALGSSPEPTKCRISASRAPRRLQPVARAQLE
jgi:hypothetical protein